MKIPGGQKIQLLNPQEEKSLMISVPSHRGTPERECSRSISAAVKLLGMDDWHVFYNYNGGANLARNRITGVEEAKKAGVDYLLFIDDDMVFEPDAISRLLAHKKDIVGGLCVKKIYPYNTTVGLIDEDGKYRMQYDFPLNKLIEVDGTGTAFLLIKMTVFDKMREPWFAFPVYRDLVNVEILEKFYEDVKANPELAAELIDGVKLSESKNVIGEDLYFCRQAQKAGFKMYVDTGVQIGHLGQYPYTIADCLRVIKEEGAPYKSGNIDEILAGH